MAHEVNAISKYLDKDGKLFLMLDPSLNSAKEPNQGLVGLMDKWGVTIGNDLVLDHIRPAFFLVGGRQPEAPTLGDFEFHQITQEVYRPVTFQLARSVTPKTNAGSDLNVKSLVKTTDEITGSWGETKRRADGTFEPDLSYTEGEDTPPPVSLAVVVERGGSESTTGDDSSTDTREESRTRIVVVGDSDRPKRAKPSHDDAKRSCVRTDDGNLSNPVNHLSNRCGSLVATAVAAHSHHDPSLVFS